MTPVIAIIKQRTAEPADPYAAAFEAAGWRAVVVEPLVVTYVDLDRLADVLAEPERWSALVLTSPRAVEAIDRAGLPAAWNGGVAWTVGEETARRAHRLGLEPVGQGAGDGAALATRIVTSRGDETRPLLFPCGDRRREEVPAGLAAAGIPFEAPVVYRVRPRPGPLLPRDPRPGWAAFFSPSGVEAAGADAHFPWPGLRVLAIGGTTAKALVAAGHPPLAIAHHPAPAALVEAARRVSNEPCV